VKENSWSIYWRQSWKKKLKLHWNVKWRSFCSQPFFFLSKVRLVMKQRENVKERGALKCRWILKLILGAWEQFHNLKEQYTRCLGGKTSWVSMSINLTCHCRWWSCRTWDSGLLMLNDLGKRCPVSNKLLSKTIWVVYLAKRRRSSQ